MVFRGAVIGGVALPLLAACGEDEGSPSGSKSPAKSGGSLVSTSEVPVGGGKILTNERVVVTQPSEGEFMAFTAVCTHQQCTVGEVKGGKIRCPCHGSQFSAEDGSVVTGPATGPLTEIEVQVKGGSVVRS